MIRILYRTPHGDDESARLILGPLGCFERGQRLEIEGVRYTVTSIDPDGAAIAFSAPYLRKRYDELTVSHPEITPEQFIEQEMSHIRTSYAAGWSGQASEAGMTAQIARNRREAGLDPAVDPR